MRPVVKYVISAVALVIAGATVLWLLVSSPAVALPGRLYIQSGSGYGAVADSLEGRVISMGRFKAVARLMGYGDGSVRGGAYMLADGMTYRQVVGMLRSGAQTPVKVTFNNMRTLPQLAGRVAQQVEADSAALLAAMTAAGVAADCGIAPAEVSALFLPDTYEVYWTISPQAFVGRMKREYDGFWNGDRRDRLAALGMTPEQAVTLASIVYEETKRVDEMPRVAGVYINRLRRGMPLQADPTLKFALGDFALRRLLDRDKQVDSPYNTYKYAGLPPGPICMPSKKAVDAVLGYEKHGYLYFCARPDYSGYHNFSATLAGHNANARRYREFLNREGIYR